MDAEKRFTQHLIAAVSFIIGLAVTIGCLLANASLPIFTRIIVTPTLTPNPWAAGDIDIVGDFVLIQPFTIQGRGFKPGDSIDILLSSTRDAPPERWTVIGEALGTNRVAADGTFSLNNVRIPSTLNPPYFIRARASSDKRLTCAVLQIDKTMISGGVAGRSCDNLPAAATSTPIPLVVTLVPAQPTPTALALITTTPMPSPTVTPLPPTPVPTSATGYWFGRFYANKDFTGNVVYDMPAAKDLAFNWGTGSPSPNVPADNFSAIWERSETFTESDQYEFTIRVDDGMRLYLDNTLISSPIEFRTGPLRTVQVSHFINAGPHTLRVEYMEESQNATIEVSWRKMNASIGAFQGKYYNGLQHANPIIYKSIDPQINMDWSLALPPDGVSLDGFSVKWDGTINITRTGRYLFNVVADSGVAILINNTSIINELNNAEGVVERTIDVPIAVTGNYNVQVFYVNRTGRGRIKLDWQFVPPPATTTPTPTMTPLPTNTAAPSTPSATPTQTPTPRNTNTPPPSPTSTRTAAPTTNPSPNTTPTRALTGGDAIIDLLRPKTATPTATPKP